VTRPVAADDRLTAVLGAASEEVARDSDGLLRVDAGSTEEMAGAVEFIVAAVLAQVDGQALPTPPRNHLTRRILQQLRAGFIQQAAVLSPPPDTGPLLVYLNALEVVGEALETDWRQRFSDRLSGPDGLELVVEVAHDLRSPLTSILFMAETLRRGRSGPLTSLQDRQLGLIYAAAFGLTSVASDVIELARGGERQLEMDPLPFSVADILESVRDIVQPIAEEKGLEVQLVAPQERPRVGYPVALSRVLLNLTTNALKFTDEGHVEVRAEAVGATHLEFSVRDTGRGIPPSSMSMLFEPFRRRQREREYAFSGSGLGLSICYGIITEHGGRIEVDSVVGEGATFRVILPVPSA